MALPSRSGMARPSPAQRGALNDENRRWPPYLTRVPRDAWPHDEGRRIVEVWRSRTFLVQVRAPRNGATWVSVNRTAVGDDGRWRDGITWDDLQGVKLQIGRGDAWAVELFPPESEVQNVNNIRHLWLLAEPPAYGFDPVGAR